MSDQIIPQETVTIYVNALRTEVHESGIEVSIPESYTVIMPSGLDEITIKHRDKEECFYKIVKFTKKGDNNG